MGDLVLERDIGQLLCVGFHGTSPSDDRVKQLLDSIAQGLVGSVILFRHNVVSPAQLTELTCAIREASTGYPVFVMIDQEGGRVQRLASSNGFTDFDSPKTVALTKSEVEAKRLYRRLGAELASVGLNFNFAPSVDLDVTPSCPVIGGLGRSFSSHVDTVARYGACFVAGLRAAGILSCLKHFPGHGSATADSHKGQTDVSEVWRKCELEPFRVLIQGGYADAVMMAHILHRDIDPDMPASLSKVWHDVLRDELGFDGVLVSDDMHMGAIQDHYDMPVIIEKALVAGTDVVVFSNNPQAAQGVAGFAPDHALPEKFNHIVKELLERGVLQFERITQSLARLLSLKSRLESPLVTR